MGLPGRSHHQPQAQGLQTWCKMDSFFLRPLRGVPSLRCNLQFSRPNPLTPQRQGKNAKNTEGRHGRWQKKSRQKKDEEQVGTKSFEPPPPWERGPACAAPAGRPDARPFFATHFFAQRIGGLGRSPNQAGGLGFYSSVPIPLSWDWSWFLVLASRRFRETADGRHSDLASVAFLNLWWNLQTSAGPSQRGHVLTPDTPAAPRPPTDLFDEDDARLAFLGTKTIRFGSLQGIRALVWEIFLPDNFPTNNSGGLRAGRLVGRKISQTPSSPRTPGLLRRAIR